MAQLHHSTAQRPAPAPVPALHEQTDSINVPHHHWQIAGLATFIASSLVVEGCLPLDLTQHASVEDFEQAIRVIAAILEPFEKCVIDELYILPFKY